MAHQISQRIENTFMMPHQCHRFPWRRHTIDTEDDYDDGLDDDLMMRAIIMEKKQ